jgi:hypothetical protein
MKIPPRPPLKGGVGGFKSEFPCNWTNNAKLFNLFGFGGGYLKTKSISSEYYRGKRENDFHFCPERIILDFKILCKINGL